MLPAIRGEVKLVSSVPFALILAIAGRSVPSKLVNSPPMRIWPSASEVIVKTVSLGPVPTLKVSSIFPSLLSCAIRGAVFSETLVNEPPIRIWPLMRG